ncbi:recombinase family protein [Nitrosophilus kaiyonis]|uniref:recombinase family protein n=1 Tax=Nitrosophilus kaiyonis TaxID=2930200 RepID=UPI0024926CDE|nr:recombinase family protein [Nitrosophilus kaiyonis]
MVYAYLRAQNIRYSIASQEKSIEDFAAKKGYSIEEKEVEISSYNKPLEERDDFRAFLHSLNSGDKLFIYDFSIFSNRVGEIVKILNCLFKRGIDIYISKYSIKINENTPAKVVVSLLNELRESFKEYKKKGLGRPKGSISKSKYDVYRNKILQLLKEGKSVNEISKLLNVSRTSLRDYIISRNLKELAATEGNIDSVGEIFIIPTSECKIEKNSKKG